MMLLAIKTINVICAFQSAQFNGFIVSQLVGCLFIQKSLGSLFHDIHKDLTLWSF